MVTCAPMRDNSSAVCCTRGQGTCGSGSPLLNSTGVPARSPTCVRSLPSGPTSPPLIAPNYLATAEDKQVAVDSIRLVRRIARSAALADVRPQEWLPGEAVQSDDELALAAQRIGTTIFHPVGTCAMGPHVDDGAVVDSRLRVHGIENLRVADASIMPTITSGNTNAPTIMIAERAAEMILQDRAGRA